MSAKASRTVLKTSRGGDLPAESAWRGRPAGACTHPQRTEQSVQGSDVKGLRILCISGPDDIPFPQASPAERLALMVIQSLLSGVRVG
jgi:hypothetical protein